MHPKRKRMRRLIALAVVAACSSTFCGAAEFPPVLDVSMLSAGEGFTVRGIEDWDRTGACSPGDDLNGDGLSDLVVRNGDSSVGKELYVVFGSDELPEELWVDALDGNNGFVVHGSLDEQDSFGTEAIGVGDVNGDGIGDYVASAENKDVQGEQNAGAAYIFFGSDQDAPPSIEADQLVRDGAGFVLLGEGGADISPGRNVAGGDLNGDGLADAVFATALSSGVAYVIFGTAALPRVLRPSDLDGTDGMTIDGTDHELLGSDLAIGDVNGDGLDDIALGATNWGSAGAAYVVFGSPGLPDRLSVADLDGTNGFALRGVGSGDDTGSGVAVADLDGDGLDDIMIGARYADPGDRLQAGAAYVVFGSAEGWPPEVSLADLDGDEGFAIWGSQPSSVMGNVQWLGDINADGFEDLGLNDSSAPYVLYGGPRPYPAVIDLALPDDERGISILGGTVPTGVGDVNADGLDDFSAADVVAPPGGAGYVVFGRSTLELAVAGSCPGEVVLEITGAPPGAAVWIAFADERGESELALGPCAGRSLSLSDPGLLATLVADAAGGATTTLDVPAPACGLLLQAMERTNCVKSAIATLP